MRRSHRERGTVAVVVALSATMIFAISALGVDLGSAFARKRDIQTQADLATLAAAAKLPYSASTKAAIEQAATDYATSNQVAGQTLTTWNFSDGDQTNGFIEYIGKNKLRLFAPQSSVDFWLAPVAGLPDGMNVSAVAAAEIRSPGRALPFYVSDTCGWGPQTILDQTAGPTIPPTYVPVLTPTSTPTSPLVIKSVTTPAPVTYPAPISVPLEIVLNGGDKFDNVEKIGFTTESGSHFVFDVSLTGNKATVSIPGAQFNEEAIWWVRLLEKGAQPTDPKLWTSSSTAKPLTVGSPDSPNTGTCDSKKSGNFGSLALSRDDVVTAAYLVENMALGVQHGFDYYPTPRPVPPDYCAGKPEAVTDSGSPVAGRLLNCLVTDTGSDLAQAATDALITGTAAGSPPRLDADDYPTTSGCGTSDREMSAIVPAKPSINNDVLSCFITDGSTVGAISSKTGAPAKALSADVFDSPRFFWIPVLVADPAGGGAGSYPIVDFRPVFITSEADESRKGSVVFAQPDNGIEMATNGKMIEKIRVRAINPVSLPDYSPDLGDRTIDYIGAGAKIVRLVE